MLTESKLQELEVLHAASTAGEWEAEYRSHSDSTQAHAVVTDESGNELFDSLNRGYKVSLLVQETDEDGHRFIDVAGFKDLACATAIRNDFPTLAASLRAAWAELAEAKAGFEDHLKSVEDQRDAALYFMHLNGHEVSGIDVPGAWLAARDARMKRLGAAEWLESQAGNLDAGAKLSIGQGQMMAIAERLKAEG